MQVQLQADYLEVTQPCAPSSTQVYGSSEVLESYAVQLKEGISKGGDSPVNALFSITNPLKVGSLNHWRFEMTNGGAGARVGMAANFGEGYGMRCLSQLPCGNFAGRGLIQGKWSKSYSSPAVVDWYIEVPSSSELVIYSVVNGEVQTNNATIQFGKPETISQLKPAATFSVVEAATAPTPATTIRVYKPVEIPTEKPYTVSAAPIRTNAEGEWSFSDPEYEGATLFVSGGHVGAKVANVMRFQVELENSSTASSGSVKWDPQGNAISTLMMPHGPKAMVEKRVKDWVKNPGSTWKVENGNLMIGELAFTPKTSPSVMVHASENPIEE